MGGPVELEGSKILGAVKIQRKSLLNNGPITYLEVPGIIDPLSVENTFLAMSG